MTDVETLQELFAETIKPIQTHWERKEAKLFEQAEYLVYFTTEDIHRWKIYLAHLLILNSVELALVATDEFLKKENQKKEKPKKKSKE